MRICTTCHKAGWEQYGQKCYDGMVNLESIAEILWYTEGFTMPTDLHVRFIPNEFDTKLQGFKAKHAYYQAPDWRYDVVRFANKVYAAYDALYDYAGIGAWMDADMVLKAPMPEGYLESLLPAGCYIALFQREGWHSETGLWLVDCAHPQHQRFFDTFLSWYESGRFAEAHEWHDCAFLDSTVRAFERERLIVAHNLSGPHSREAHPMALHPINRYCDHLKGGRKQLGYSPERERALAA